MKRRDGSLEKSARLIVLMEIQDGGLLESLSLQQIANLFPDKPHRSTIMRDLRDVAQLRKTLKAMRSSTLANKA